MLSVIDTLVVTALASNCPLHTWLKHHVLFILFNYDSRFWPPERESLFRNSITVPLMVTTPCLRRNTERNSTCFQGKTGNYKKRKWWRYLKNINKFWKTSILSDLQSWSDLQSLTKLVFLHRHRGTWASFMKKINNCPISLIFFKMRSYWYRTSTDLFTSCLD